MHPSLRLLLVGLLVVEEDEDVVLLLEQPAEHGGPHLLDLAGDLQSLLVDEPRQQLPLILRWSSKLLSCTKCSPPLRSDYYSTAVEMPSPQAVNRNLISNLTLSGPS